MAGCACCSSGGGVPTVCCPGGLPSNLHLTISGVTTGGFCDSGWNGTYELIYNCVSGTGYWSWYGNGSGFPSTASCPAPTFFISFQCQGTLPGCVNFYLIFAGNMVNCFGPNVGGGAWSSCTCSPPFFTGTITDANGDSVTFTVTP